MAYVIVAVLVVLIVAGFAVFLVTNAANKSDPAGRGGSRPPGIGTDDETPLGDTTEHGDERTADPQLVGRHETADPDEAAHRARPGEAEGEEQVRFEPEQPSRERREP
jgi:hypothetical protein